MVNRNKPAAAGDGEGGSHRPACAACKYQRKKCTTGCPLRRHFPANETAGFTNVYTIFGLANVSRMMKRRESIQDQDRVAMSLKWEAAAWEKDPVNGPYGVVLKLQDEIKKLHNRLQEWEKLPLPPPPCACSITNPNPNPNPNPNNSFHVNTSNPNPNGNATCSMMRPDVNNHSFHVNTAIPNPNGNDNGNGHCRPMMRRNVNSSYNPSFHGGARVQPYPLPRGLGFQPMDSRFVHQENHGRPLYMPAGVPVQYRTGAGAGPNEYNFVANHPSMRSNGWSEGQVNRNFVPSSVATPTQYVGSERNQNTTEGEYEWDKVEAKMH